MAAESQRVVLAGARVFDGTGSPPAQADVVVSDGQIVAVGRGLDGDERIDLTGKGLRPA